ncbi:MAG: dephospho-CoA kinase [Caulobacteraceae bacterium]
MILLGLTGSMGMGKSTTAQMFAEAGAAVYDADAVVHGLYARGGGAAEYLAPHFPEAVSDGAVDREALSRRVKADPGTLKRLEQIVHPLLAAKRRAFLDQAEATGARVALLDIPLLFETGGETTVDAVVVVTAPPEVQTARVLARPGMDAEKFALLAARQTPDAEKRARADFIVDTGQGLDAAREQVAAVMAVVLAPGWNPRQNRS